MGPHPAVAEVRAAVRTGLVGLASGDLVLVACSGGADSLALAAALAFTAPRLQLRGGGVTVDHGLQPGSAERAGAVARRLTELGLDPVLGPTVTVARPDDDSYLGPEAAARPARRRAHPARAHPGRSGRDGPARAGPRLWRPVPGRHAGQPGPVPAAGAGGAPGPQP